MKVKIKKLSEDAVIPKYSKDGDAGMDLTITSVKVLDDEHIKYGFGLAIEIPKGYVGLIFPRSSIRKKGLVMINSVGVIDSGYRGEIQCTFLRTIYENGWGDVYEVGERICQLVIIPYPQINLIPVKRLSDSDRGEGGHGSTGKY